jgi:redox-sensing transcriptional repressor
VTRKVSASTVRRLSHYLRILEALEREGEPTLSSTELARAADTTAAQVRKDLSLFGSFGKRGMGYRVADLKRHILGILGLERPWRVVMAGAGRIGAALFEYGNFRRRGFEIVAVLDTDPAKIGTRWGEVTIRPASELPRVIRDEGVEILILTVPNEAAQTVADAAIAAGVRGILNFAPVQLRVPPHVFVQDVNMVMELEALSFDLSRAPAAPSPETASTSTSTSAPRDPAPGVGSAPPPRLGFTPTPGPRP